MRNPGDVVCIVSLQDQENGQVKIIDKSSPVAYEMVDLDVLEDPNSAVVFDFEFIPGKGDPVKEYFYDRETEEVVTVTRPARFDELPPMVRLGLLKAENDQLRLENQRLGQKITDLELAIISGEPPAPDVAVLEERLSLGYITEDQLAKYADTKTITKKQLTTLSSELSGE